MNDMQETAIKHLELLLELAKQGKISSYFIMAKKHDGLVELRYGQNETGYFDLLGYIECGKTKIIEDILNNECRKA